MGFSIQCCIPSWFKQKEALVAGQNPSNFRYKVRAYTVKTSFTTIWKKEQLTKECKNWKNLKLLFFFKNVENIF